jgi:hypothetical protein
MIDTIIPYYETPDGARSFMRGANAFTKGEMKSTSMISDRFDSLSSYWVDTITNDFDQDISGLWVGPKGSGKSSAVLSVSYHCAVRIAEWANDGSKWDEYYNLHTLTACILEDEATRLMNIQEPYVVKNYDDIGIGWNARDWQDDENQQKNDIFQINRTDRAIQSFSVPSQFLLDKVPRSLVNHYIEMDQQLFEKGFTTIKVFKPKTMFRESNKIINPYLIVDRNKYVNYLIPAPPHDLWSEYKKLRHRNKDIAIRMRSAAKQDRDLIKQQKAAIERIKLQKKQDSLIPKDNQLVVSQSEQRHKDWDAAFIALIPKFKEAKKEHPNYKYDKIINIVGRKHHISERGVSYWRSKEYLEKYGLIDE